MSQRPNLTYHELIRLALLSQPDGRATVGQIYEFIEMSFPYYKAAPECRFWKNSIRHTLCKNQNFHKIEAVHVDDGKPYKRGKAIWEFCSDGTTTDPQTSPLALLVQKTPSQAVHSGVRPGSVDSACTDEWNTVSPYPWPPIQAEYSPFDVGTGPSATSIPAEETPTHSKLSFFTPWTPSPDQLPKSHLEAPHLNDFRTPPSDLPIDHPPPYSSWLHGQDYPSSWGCVTSPLPVGGAWTDSASDAVRGASQMLPLPNSPYPVALYPSQLAATSQYMYPDGNFWYLPAPSAVPHYTTNVGQCYERQFDVSKEPN